MSAARVSRPQTQSLMMQERMMSSLPDIAHPASRLGNPVDIQIATSAPHNIVSNMLVTDRSLIRAPDEVPFRVARSAAVTPRVASSGGGIHLPPISRGSAVISASGTRPSIPVLGQKSDVQLRTDSAQSHFSSTSNIPDYQSKLKLEVDELLAAVTKKVNDNFYNVRNAFVTSDIDGQGAISRDQCHRVLMTVMGRTISLKHFNHLLVRVGLADRSIINYTQFYTAFREKDSSEPPAIFDSQFKHFAQDKNMLTATQVNALLKEKARKRVLELGDIIPNFTVSDDPNDKGRIMKPELYSALLRHGFNMSDAEFDKLWARYDEQNLGVVDSKLLAKKLGIHFMKSESSDISEKSEVSKRKVLGGHEVERKLLGELHRSHVKVREAFSELDPDQKGFLPFEDMFKAFATLGIDISKAVMLEMLHRHGIMCDATNTSVPYDDLLEKIQSHKDDDAFSKLVNEIRGNEMTQSITSVEQKLKNLFQPHLQHLLEAFDKADRLHLMFLSQDDFKNVLETELNIKIDDKEMESLSERLPLDEDGHVLYLKFLDQFNFRAINGAILEESEEENEEAWEEFEKGRSAAELTKQIKIALREHYFDMEHYYKTNIDYNTDTGKLTQVQLKNMLNSFMVPELNHGEVRTLWKTFHLNQNKTLDYQMFVRHFLYDKRTAAFPSQRVLPPQIGDSDLIRRSNMVNSSRDLVFNMLHRKLDVYWNQVRGEMKYLDPYHTGFVSYQQFKNVMSELQVELDPYELNVLCEKFDTANDKRVNYIAMLEQFAGRTKPTNMVEVFNQNANKIPDDSEVVVDKMTEMTNRLRERLLGDVKNLRKAFKKLDDTKSGYLSISEFRSVLELCNVVLDEEESFQLAARYDDNLSGKLKYDSFLRDLQKTPKHLKDRPLVNTNGPLLV